MTKGELQSIRAVWEIEEDVRHEEPLKALNGGCQSHWTVVIKARYLVLPYCCHAEKKERILLLTLDLLVPWRYLQKHLFIEVAKIGLVLCIN